MSADAFVQCRVSQETKAFIRDLASRRDLTESALLRSLLENLAQSSERPPTSLASTLVRAHRQCRVCVRLADEDRELLAGRARDRNLAPATYVAVLTRSHLRGLTPLPRDELLALKSLIGELAAVGRNLNQLARAVNSGGLSFSANAQQVTSLLRLSTGLRDHVKALILANEVSWRSGFGQDSR